MADLRRSRSTWAWYAVFGSWGWVIYSFAPAVPLVADEVGLTASTASLLATAVATGTVVAGLATHRVVARLNRLGAFFAGAGLLTAGLLGLALSRVVVGLLLAAFVIGLGTLVLNVGVAALVDGHGDSAQAAVSEANAVAAFSGAAAPAVLGLVVVAGLGWRPNLVAVVPVLVVLLLVMRGSASPDRRQPIDPGGHGRLPSRFWWAWGALVTLVGVEFCFTIWSPSLIASRTGVGIGAATTALTAFVLSIAVGRAVGARVALRVDATRLLVAAIGLAILGWVVVWTASTLATAVVGLVLSGLGVSLHYPLGVARATASAPRELFDRAAGISAVGFGMAVGIAPFALGSAVDAYGLRDAFLVVPMLLLSSLVVLVAGEFTHNMDQLRGETNASA